MTIGTKTDYDVTLELSVDEFQRLKREWNWVSIKWHIGKTKGIG